MEIMFFDPSCFEQHLSKYSRRMSFVSVNFIEEPKTEELSQKSNILLNQSHFMEEEYALEFKR
jgi:hypothetical protein